MTTPKEEVIKFALNRNVHFEDIKKDNVMFTYKDLNEILIFHSKRLAEDIFKELDNNWASRKKDYNQHICNGQDGTDISFTKKDFERIKKRFCE